MATFSIFDIKNNIGLPKPENSGEFTYIFSVPEKENENNVVFYIWLKNSGNYLINKIWFYSFIGLQSTYVCVPVKNLENFFTVNKFFDNHFSGYSKEEFKLPPCALVDIFYFEIPRNILKESGCLEFSYGADHIKKHYFSASWEKGEIDGKILNREFLNFIKIKNRNYKIVTFFENLFLSKWSVIFYIFLILLCFLVSLYPSLFFLVFYNIKNFSL